MESVCDFLGAINFMSIIHMSKYIVPGQLLQKQITWDLRPLTI